MDSRSTGLVRLLRPRQWVKNAFVLAPLLFSARFTEPQAVWQALLACALFSLAASATYIVNDLHDMDNDRRHPEKARQRPLAAGIVTPREAITLLAAVLLLLVAGCLQVPPVGLVIIAYLLLSLAYTLLLKRRPVLDIFTIAALFVLRVYGGAVAIEVELSSWMFVTTLCMALYLAAIKRRQELLMWGSEARSVLNDYTLPLIDRYAALSAAGALLFYSLYVMTEHPEMAFTLPLVLYGLFRYWFLVETRNIGESPTDALLSDIPLLLTSLALVASFGWAILRSP